MTGSGIAPIWPMGAGSPVEPREHPMTIANLTALPEPRVAFDRISLRRLVLIRWVAIAGQALTLLVVHYGFGFHLPLLSALAVVGCSALVNLVIPVYRRGAARLGERYAAYF